MNPTFEIPESILSSSFGEAIFPIVVMGDKAAGTVKKIWVEYLFGKSWENMRLNFVLILVIPRLTFGIYQKTSDFHLSLAGLKPQKKSPPPTSLI